MQLDEVQPLPHAESWVHAAYTMGCKAGGGSFSLVLDSDLAGHVVKLTQSTVAYKALVHFSGTSSHFPQVIKYATNQATGKGRTPFHALLMEKVDAKLCPETEAITRYLGRQESRTRPFGLYKVVNELMNRRLDYPESLMLAIKALAAYAQHNFLRVELHERSNWGKRADGTLVMLDLVQTDEEMGEDL